MKPTSPIVPGLDLPETVYAKDQPEYQPLPTYRDATGCVLSRWRVSWRERLRILHNGNIYLTQKTFQQPLQPVRLTVEPPEIGDD